MLNIPYNPKAFIFTSYLPDTVEIVSDAPSVKVDVKCDDELVFTATFYPYEGLATLYDIRSVVENYMEGNRLNFVNFVINAETSEESTSTNGCTLIYSRADVESVYVPDFIRSHFLTTMSSFVIPQNGTQFLTYITEPNQVVNAYTECLVHVDGEDSPRLVKLKENEATYDHTARNFVVVIPQRILKRLNVKGRIFQLTVHRGGLAKTFYVVDRTPDLTLIVRNEFNAEEYIHLNCVTKRKLVLDRSTTTCLSTTTKLPIPYCNSPFFLSLLPNYLKNDKYLLEQNKDYVLSLYPNLTFFYYSSYKTYR